MNCGEEHETAEQTEPHYPGLVWDRIPLVSFLKPSAHSRFLSLRQAIFVFSLKNLLCAVT